MKTEVEQASLAIKRAHLQLMKNTMTYLYAGVIMLGESRVLEEDDPLRSQVKTAATDGINKLYNPAFVNTLTAQQHRGLVLHENLHVVTKQISRHKDLWKEDPQLANAAADYVVNLIIQDIAEKDPAFISLPPKILLNKRFTDWSLREVYRFLKTGQDRDGKKHGKPRESVDSDGDPTVCIGGHEYSLEPLDEHDTHGASQATPEQVKALSEQIDQALQQSALLAGTMGMQVPRAMGEAMTVTQNWREALREFVVSSMQGHDEYSFRAFNRRRLVDDCYRPVMVSERVGRIVVAIDTSGSISQQAIAKVGEALASIGEACNPEEIRVLWWDTMVHGEQVFAGTYDGMKGLLKPLGGGGTQASCVSQYVVETGLQADCLINFTDGYLEHDINWATSIPTLWIVDGNNRFSPPKGKVVKFSAEG